MILTSEPEGQEALKAIPSSCHSSEHRQTLPGSKEENVRPALPARLWAMLALRVGNIMGT